MKSLPSGLLFAALAIITIIGGLVFVNTRRSLERVNQIDADVFAQLCTKAKAMELDEEFMASISTTDFLNNYRSIRNMRDDLQLSFVHVDECEGYFNKGLFALLREKKSMVFEYGPEEQRGTLGFTMPNKNRLLLLFTKGNDDSTWQLSGYKFATPNK